MLSRSISSGSTTPRPTATARRRISTSSRSRRAAVRTFEYATPSRRVPGGKTTAAATTGPASGLMPTSSTPATCRMPTRQRSVSRCGAAVAGPRRRFLGRRPPTPIPECSASKERGGLSKRAPAEERQRLGDGGVLHRRAGGVRGAPRQPRPHHRGRLRRDRLRPERRLIGADERRRPPPVPPIDAVVPGEPDRLRARARRRDAEPEAMPRAVEEPRAQVQVAELPPERAALDRARVAPEAPVLARARGQDRVGGEHAVFQREGDALAHERVAPGCIPNQERARRRDPRAGRVGADGERLPRSRPRADACQLSGELGLETCAVDRRERVDADVGVRHAVDHAGERPAIAAEPRRARGEVELVAARGVAVPARLGDGDVAHDGARHGAFAAAHERAAHDAPAPVGADHDGRPVRAAIRLDAHARAVAGEIDDALALAQLDAALARRPGERRVELAPADDAAEVRAADREDAARDGDARGIDPRVGNRERDAQLLEQAQRLGDDTPGARLVPGVTALVEEERARGELRRHGGEPERRSGSGGSRADDDGLAPFHERALSAPRRPPPLPATLSPNRASGQGAARGRHTWTASTCTRPTTARELPGRILATRTSRIYRDRRPLYS